ncbi:MAG: hypothetical protein M5U12_15595 [Verrucomicrobia bacterium]|nr:hypothetical protein [Verrucomicrobiota bacterium]
MKVTLPLLAGLIARAVLVAQPLPPGPPVLPTLPLGHDRTRPLPPVVAPGHASSPTQSVRRPRTPSYCSRATICRNGWP